MNAHIFLGPELGKKQDSINATVNKFSKTGGSIETSVFYANETPVSEIANTLQNKCLFADSRIITVKNADLIKKKDEIDLLVSCIKNLDSDTLLLLLSDEIKLAAGLDKAVPASNRIVFYEMLERDKTEWLRQFFNDAGYAIDNDGIATILELVENNTSALKNECSKLISFMPKENAASFGNDSCGNIAITAEMIEKWLSHNREESAFTLFSHIAAGNLQKALGSMSVMLSANESPVSILAGLAWCFRKLGDYLSLLERGDANNFEELRNIGLSSPKAKADYAAAARRYNIDSTETCLALTAQYDLLIRSPVAVMQNILMDRFILLLFKAASNTHQ